VKIVTASEGNVELLECSAVATLETNNFGAKVDMFLFKLKKTGMIRPIGQIY
jgi:hypothetical protein